MSADSLVAVSPAISAGRWEPSAPVRRASAAMPSWSVETITRSMLGLDFAALIARASSENNAAKSSPSIERVIVRSEEHTSELQSRVDLVCRLLLEKKKHSALL